MPDYIRNSKYRNEFSGLKPNTEAFDRKWKSLAASDHNGFAEDQENYIKKTHYDPLSRKLRRIGLDVN